MVEQQELISYPLADPPSLHHPSDQLTELRQSCPVAQVRLADGTTGWLVTRYADARQVLTDPRFSRVAVDSGAALPALAEVAKESLLGMDPPEHTRLRRLVVRAFAARRVEELRPRIARIVDELLDAMEAMPRPVDLVENFSLPLPMQVICELLGAPAEDGKALHAWSDAMVGGWAADPVEATAAMDTMYGYFADLIAAKRAEPADDLITALIAARDEEAELSERELVMLCLGLLAAGHEATVTYVNLLLVTLMSHPQELPRLGADPALVPQAVEELMRFVQVNADGAGMPRFTREEVLLSGVTVPAGATVMPALAAAGRDPARFVDPDRLDLARSDNPHLAFGAGIHHCLGAQLARIELQETLRAFGARAPGLRLAVPESELRFTPGTLIRSFESLPVTW